MTNRAAPRPTIEPMQTFRIVRPHGANHILCGTVDAVDRVAARELGRALAGGSGNVEALLPGEDPDADLVDAMGGLDECAPGLAPSVFAAVSLARARAPAPTLHGDLAMPSPRKIAKSERFKLHREKAAATRAILVERFPLCFMPKGEPKKPLAIGLTPAVIAACPDLSPNDIRDAIRDYGAGPTYLRAMTIGATRVGLDRQPRGTVDEGGAEIAACRLRVVLAQIDVLAVRRKWAAGQPAGAEREAA